MTDLADALLLPRLCSLLPTIMPTLPGKPRFCVTCEKLHRAPYRCPLDDYRDGHRALSDTRRPEGERDA